MSGYVPRHNRPGKEPDNRQDAPSTPSLPALSGSDKGQGAPKISSAPDRPTAQSKGRRSDRKDARKATKERPAPADQAIVAEEALGEDGEFAIAPTRKRRWPLTIAIILLVIIVGGAITYFVLSTQALQREANRTAAYELLDEAIALVQESDHVIIALDSATVTEVTEANVSERELLLTRVATTLDTLAPAEEKARTALDLLISEEDRELAQHVIDAVVNRNDMLASGEVIITKDIEAMNAALLFGQAWQLIISVDTELRETAELSKTGNYNQLREAVERNNAILPNLQQAIDLLTEAQRGFQDADFSTVIVYASLKKESVQLAIEADEAILAADLEAVTAKNLEFGLKDAAVVEAASRIPSEPLTLITSAYEAAIADYRAKYASARANATEADSHIREYVGVETQTAVQ